MKHNGITILHSVRNFYDRNIHANGFVLLGICFYSIEFYTIRCVHTCTVQINKLIESFCVFFAKVYKLYNTLYSFTYSWMDIVSNWISRSDYIFIWTRIISLFSPKRQFSRCTNNQKFAPTKVILSMYILLYIRYLLIRTSIDRFE